MPDLAPPAPPGEPGSTDPGGPPALPPNLPGPRDSASQPGLADQPGLAERFPALFAPQRWEWGGIDARFSTAAPPDALVTNIHVVGFTGSLVVVCRAGDDWFLPGGTREDGESIDACAARELREEAGARLASPLRWIGAHACVTDRPAPYRPWQPHPRKAWLWCSADVVVDSLPTCPDDAEQVTEVRAVSPAEAGRLLARRPGPGAPEAWDGPGGMPDLIGLAVETRV